MHATNCPRCNYDLAGHFDSAETLAICPECGRVVTRHELELDPPPTKTRALRYSVCLGLIPTGLAVICSVLAAADQPAVAIVGIPASAVVGAVAAAIGAAVLGPPMPAPRVPRSVLFVMSAILVSFIANAFVGFVAFLVFGFPTRIC